MSRSTMKDFWDARADEDPFYFVDNRGAYKAADLERFWGSGREQLERMLELLGVCFAPTDDVLEIGCGVGRLTRMAAEQAASVIALDISERMLDVAKELNPGLENVHWVLGDGVSLSGVEDEGVDVCQSYVVFHHIPDPEIALGYVREIGRVLRPAGWAALQVSNDPAKHRPQGRGRRLRLAWRGIRGRGPKGQAHSAWRGSPMDLGRLREVAGSSGMTVDRVVGEGRVDCLVLLRKSQTSVDPQGRQSR